MSTTVPRNTAPRKRRTLRIESLERRLLLADGGLFGSALPTLDQAAWHEASGLIEDSTVVDQFQLTIAKGVHGRLRIWADAVDGGTLDTFLALNGPDGNLLIHSDDVGEDRAGTVGFPRNANGSLIDQHLRPGTYQLSVSASPFANEGTDQGEYSVHVDWQPAEPPGMSIPVDSQPWGITSGDFNGDGILDLATANNLSNDVTILLGLGDGTFFEKGRFDAGGDVPSSVLAVDFDGDGNLDLGVTNAVSNDISILFGDGDGNFAAGDPAPVGTEPSGMAVRHLDSDGQPNLIVVPNKDDGTLSILLLQEDGTLQVPLTIDSAAESQGSQGGSPTSAAIGYIDGDSWLDVVVTNRKYDEVALFFGNSQGMIDELPGMSIPVGDGPQCVVIEDFNGDGILDLATVNDKSNDVSVALGLGGGEFYPRVDYPAGDDAEFMLTGDFNGDGHIDLVTGNEDSRNISVLLNNGDGSFQPQITTRVDHLPDDLTAGDFNADGRLDLAVVSREDAVDILFGLGNGHFVSDNKPLVGLAPEAIVHGDFNRDGLMDLAIANGQTDDVSILLGRGEGRFQPALHLGLSTDFNGDGKARGNEIGEVPQAIVTADFNADGRLDLATANARSNNVSILLGLGTGRFLHHRNIAVGTTPWSLVAEDFDGDGNVDLAVANRGSDEISVLFGRGNGDFADTRSFGVGSFPVQLVAEDFNDDGWLDLGSVNRLSHDVSILLGTAERAFSAEQRADEFPVGGVRPTDVPGWDIDQRAHIPSESDYWFFPRMPTTGDYNEDGHLDLAVANDVAHEVSLFLGHGDGTYQPEIRFPVAYDPEFITTADLDADGHLDIVLANDKGEFASVLWGSGDGRFAERDGTFADVDNGDPGRVLPVGDGTESLTVGHFNADELLDVAVIAGGDPDQIQIFLGDLNDAGQMTFHTDDSRGFAAGSDSEETLRAYDFNGDGYTDLATVDRESPHVYIFLGNGDGTFGSEAGGTFWTDTDEDRDNDKLMFRPHPILVPGAPQSLAAADMNGDGILDLILPERNSHSVWVLPGRGDGTFVTENPSEREWRAGDAAFSTPWDYAGYTVVVGDFDEDAIPDIATANERDGNLWILFGDGHGNLRETRKFATGGQPVAIVAEDANADGHLDIISANAWSHDVSILLGNGSGMFTQATRIAGRQEPPVIAWADFNADGFADRATADANAGKVAVELAVDEAAGTFAAAECISPGIHGTPVLADLNADGQADAIQINQQGQILVRMARPDEAGTFTAYQIVNAGASGQAARDATVAVTAAGVFIAAVNQAEDSISLYAADATGRFRSVDTLAVGGQGLPLRSTLPTKVAAADLDGDGQDDLVVIDGAGRKVSVYLADSAGYFSTRLGSYAVGAGPGEVALVDVGSPTGGPDGRLDIVVSNAVSGDVSILINQGKDTPADNLSFAPGLRLRASTGLYGIDEDTSTVRSSAQAAGIASGDFNRDGAVDLILANPAANTISLLLGKPAGGFVDPVSLPGGGRPTGIHAADFDNDGLLDLAILNALDATIATWLGNGQGEFSQAAEPADAGHSPGGFSVDYVNDDKHLDLLVGNEMGDLLPLLGAGDGTFAPPPLARGKHVALAVADVDGDGRDDLVIANEAKDEIWVQHNDGRIPLDDDVLLAPGAVEVADLNVDGQPDLIVANSGANSVLVYLGLGNGHFEPAESFDVGTQPVSLTIHDVNTDGRPDVIVANKGSNDVSILIGDAQSLLQPGVRVTAGTAPVATEVGDFDGDGTIELLIVNSGDDTVHLLSDRGDGFFTDQNPTIFETGASPSGLFVDQFDAAPGLDLVTLDRLSNSVTYYSGFAALARDRDLVGRHLGRTIASGGAMPVDAVVTHANADRYADLFVAHRSGSVSLLLGNGLGLSGPTTLRNLSTPLSSLDLWNASAGVLSFVATIEGSSDPIWFAYSIETEVVGEVDVFIATKEEGLEGDVYFAPIGEMGPTGASVAAAGQSNQAAPSVGANGHGVAGPTGGSGPKGPPGPKTPDPQGDQPPPTENSEAWEKIADRAIDMLVAGEDWLYFVLEELLVELDLPIAPDHVYDAVRMVGALMTGSVSFYEQISEDVAGIASARSVVATFEYVAAKLNWVPPPGDLAMVPEDVRAFPPDLPSKNRKNRDNAQDRSESGLAEPKERGPLYWAVAGTVAGACGAMLAWRTLRTNGGKNELYVLEAMHDPHRPKGPHKNIPSQRNQESQRVG